MKDDTNNTELNKTTEPKTDDFGYEVESSDDKPTDDKPTDDKPADDKPADDKPADDKKSDEKSVTGYGDDKPADDKKPDEKPTDDKPADDKKPDEKPTEEKEIAELLGAAKDVVNVDLIKDFALKNKMTKEQVKAYVELVKSENEQAVKQAENEKIKLRESWHKELVDDKEFGVEFKKNLHKVDQLLEKHMPDTKKLLTERRGMLPPYIMKDLLRLSKVLNPNTTFEAGDPSTPKEKDKNFLDEMYS
jgi:hypothetical protein